MSDYNSALAVSLPDESAARKTELLNNVLNAVSPSAVFGYNSVSSAYLTWAYFGGALLVNGTLATIAAGTLTLAQNATNYIECDQAGAVSANTTAFTAGRIALYSVVTNTNGPTSWTDFRETIKASDTPLAGVLSKSVAGGADVTLTAAEVRNRVLKFTGALTANINVIVPTSKGVYVIDNQTSGSYILTVKTAAGTGVAVTQTAPVVVYVDGTKVVGISAGAVVGLYASYVTNDSSVSGTTVKDALETIVAVIAALSVSDIAGLGTMAVQNSAAVALTGGTINGVEIGYRTVPQNSKSADYTTVMSDGGKHILHPSADTTARTFTIDSNANVAYPIGTALTFVNQDSAGVLTIAITSDTMRLAGAGTTGSRTLAANGVATALKLTSTEWLISGTGLT